MLATPAVAETFIYRLSVAPFTSMPNSLLALISGNPISMQVDADGAIIGTLVNSASTYALVYQNNHTVALNIANVTTSDPDNFSITSSTCSGVIEPAAVCTVDVRFSSEKNGTFNASLNITYTTM